MYDLKAIVIHRGGPYGGHYHAYIRDDLKEGVWNLKLPEAFAAEPTEVVKKKEPVEDKKEEEKKEEVKAEEDDINEKDIDWSSLSKQERKALAKKLKAKKN
mmetsp:Transcript_15139/g.20544  ORF Transcript_15139/g.20544 Transcript_15139/m.20544 type:complete len:101 (+) Transcript_15139:924-1226(+)